MTKRLPTAVGVSTAAFALVLFGGRPAAQPSPGLPYELLVDRPRAEALLAAWNANASYIPGEVVVKFRAGTGTVSQGRALSALRGDARAVRSVGDTRVVAARDEPNPELAADVLRRQPEVEWAQPNYLRRQRVTPNDPSYPAQWNLETIGLPTAWDVNPGANSNIRIAVVDGGVNTVSTTFGFPLWTGTRIETVPVPVAINPDIATARVLAGRDFVFWNGPVVDFSGHGSWVAGTALQETNNSVGTAGVAYRATLLPVKACLGYWELAIITAALGIPGFPEPFSDIACSDEALTAGIRYAADNGAHAINISLGGFAPAPALLDALRYATQRGSFVAISAGNEFLQGNPIEYPAAYGAQIEGVVAVGAVGRSRRRAVYSSTGQWVELAAPGGDVSDGGTSGAIQQFGLLRSDFNPFSVIRPRFDRYEVTAIQGTSFAAPHVAGLAALLNSQGITTPAAIEAAMKQSATDLGPPGRDNEYGVGLINPRAALRGMGLAR